MSKGSGNYHQRLHALDATTGSELNNGHLTGTGETTSGGYVYSDPASYKERAGLLSATPSISLGFALRYPSLHGMDHGL